MHFSLGLTVTPDGIERTIQIDIVESERNACL